MQSITDVQSVVLYFPPPFSELPEGWIVPPFTDEELRFWQLYPRVPFDITHLYLLQGECFLIVLDFEWFTINGNIATPTESFLARCATQDELLRDEANHA